MVLDKIYDQAAGIGQDRNYVVKALANTTPEFSRMLEKHL